MTPAKPVILTLTPSIAREKGKDLKINKCTNLRSFVVCATQDDGAVDRWPRLGERRKANGQP
jgi:hypothetical protein